MRAKFFLLVVFLLMGVSNSGAQQTDLIDSLARYFRAADAAKIADEFSSKLQLNILDEESVYSNAQAEQIMRDFLSKNKPVSVKIISRLSSNPSYKLAVLSMVTGKDKFRISISLSSSGTRFLIKEMRIEYDKQ
ncbi:DUF4783 domain-containing protein [Daejeonella lutea]|nr:DUF4783 domain-containing protein [Daejeonella lutea]